MQKPHPRIWIPGVISKETIVWAAQHGYPYIALNTPVDRTRQVWDIYDTVAAEHGFTGGPAYHGLFEADPCRRDRGKALENARQFTWMQGEFTGLAHPSGALRLVTAARTIAAPLLSFPSADRKIPWPSGVGETAGRPDGHRRNTEAVIAKLRILLEETRPGILGFWGNDGTVPHQDAMTCIRLLGQEVFPAVREIAKELDLKSPFETEQPVSLRYMPATPWPSGGSRVARLAERLTYAIRNRARADLGRSHAQSSSSPACPGDPTWHCAGPGPPDKPGDDEEGAASTSDGHEVESVAPWRLLRAWYYRSVDLAGDARKADVGGRVSSNNGSATIASTSISLKSSTNAMIFRLPGDFIIQHRHAMQVSQTPKS